MATTELTPSPAVTAITESALIEPASTEFATSEPQPQRVASERLRLPLELRGTGTRSLVLSWLASRALALALMVTLEVAVTGDVQYYARSLHDLFSGGSIREVLQEYPLPVLLIMLPQYLVGALNSVAFTTLFAVSMLVVDALFTWSLWRACGRTRGEAVTFWLWFVPAIGPMAYFRFDLVPAMLAGAAVLTAARRPAWSGALTAIGAALKLWPALMLPTLLLRRVDRRRVLVGFLLTGAAFAGLSLLVGGIGRVLSPLNWQKDRGLQIESIAATPLMIGRMIHRKHVWNIKVSQYKAWEIFGWGVHPVLILTTVATAAGIGLLGWFWYRARALPVVSVETLGWMFLATSTVVTVTNKTLSPQYILWLGGPLAALMARAPGDLMVRRAGKLLLAICVLTQGVYPITYSHLESGRGWQTFASVGMLTSRNVLLIVLTWLACRQVWRLTRPVPTPADVAADITGSVTADVAAQPTST
jgi:hypothetical protein